MADIESNIKVNIDTSDALSQLKLLQQQISAFQQAMRNAGSANASAAAAMQQNLITSINATGKFRANIQTIKTSAESFTEALEKNKMSIGEYFRYAGGASKTFGKLFKSEFQTIQQVAVERVKTLQTQYIKLGRDANGAMKAIAVKPLALDMESVATKTQIAAQKQQLFNQLMKQGSTQLLNFGKNTQWAGRQLMVGFTIPLTMMGTAAAKAYMQIEQASIKFRRVYGDMNTTTEEANKMVKTIQQMANEFTKYGLAVSETMDMAASAAAMGKTGADLMAQVAQASKLAVLGGVEQQQALDTTISLTNAFKISTEQLAGSVDFLNAVENQTVLSIEDMTVAIPKAAPVIQQLGGDVKDLAFFLTAMREGGINASEGANALKSGLASMINPTAKASQFLQSFGINIKGIVEANKGDVRGTVVSFAKALDTLDPLNRARAIEQMFGKFQFSRISTLFQNVIADGSQANNVLNLANSTTEELAILSEREMKKVSDSPMFKFQKSIQDMQAKLAPVGEAFLKAVTPIIEFVTKILDGFNNLGEGSKQFITILVTAVAGIGPILLMTFGLIANGVANIMKLFTGIKSFINKTTKPSDLLGEQTQYMTTEQLKAAAIAASLDQAHAKLKQTFTSEAAAVDALTQAYRRAVEAQQSYSGIPGVPVGNPNVAPKKYAGGVSMVPGPNGAGDIVPALLSPGEAVIPAKMSQKYAPVIRGMIAGNLPGFEDGTPGAGMRQSTIGPLTERQTEGLARTGKTLKEISDEVYAGPYNKMPITDFGTQVTPTTGHSFPAFGVGGIYLKPDGTKVFVKPQMDATSALAEIRGTEIARSAHGLVSPQQKLAVMMDPTDPENKRKFIVLESLLDERLADVPKTFSKDNYIKQLVASLLRGDKDLGVGNLGENILADVGPAGVFQRASGKRALGGRINSMEEQAIINLLGVKGGAKRFFAESTAEIAKSMTPSAFDAAMKAEIQSVAPKLATTIAGFGNLSPEEKAAYENMQQRLQAGMSVDWAKYQVMHSGVTPKQYEEGTSNVKWGSLANEETRTLISQLIENKGFQRSHLAHDINMENNEEALNAIRTVYGKAVNFSNLEDYKILGNLTADLPNWMNQAMRNETSYGIPGTMWSQSWNAIKGKMFSTAEAAGLPSTANLQVQQIEDEIGQAALKYQSDSKKKNANKKLNLEKVVYDNSLDSSVIEVLNKYAQRDDIFGEVAKAFQKRANLPGTMRSVSKDEDIKAGLRNGTIGFTETGNQIVQLDANRNPVGDGNLLAGRWMNPDSKKYPEKRQEFDRLKNVWREKWAGRYNSPEAINDLLSIPGLKFRDTSMSSGAFSKSKTGYTSYEETTPKFSSIPDPQIFTPVDFARKFGYDFVTSGFMKLAKGTSNVKSNGKPKASVFDIDDTLVHASALIEANREKNDKLPKEQRSKWYEELAKNPQGVSAAIERLKAAQARGNKILLMTARPESYRASTLEMLQKLGIDMNGIQLITRRDKDYRKPDQMKMEKTSKYMQWYDIEEFYDDLPATRDAINTLGIPTFDPLALAKGGIIPGYADGIDKIVKDVSLKDLDIPGMKKDKLGAIAGGFRIINGKKYYIKNPKSPTDASIELIMSELNRAMGNPGAHTMNMFGKGLVGSEFVPGLKNTMYSTMKQWIESQPRKLEASETLITAAKDFITKDAAFNAMIGNDDGHTNNIVFNPKTRKFVNLDLGVNSAENKNKSTSFNPSAQMKIAEFKANIVNAIRTVISEKNSNALLEKYGISYGSKTGKLGTYDTSPEIAKMAELLGFDLSKPIAQNPINLKTNPFVLSLLAKNPELANILELESSSNGVQAETALSRIFKTLQSASKKPVLKLANGGMVKKYANGVFSVPGPKGAGDVVPAMLSPGEAVIPAKQASQHRGLISSMIAGNIPGYEEGLNPYPGSGFGVGNPMPVAIMKDYTVNPVNDKTPEDIADDQEQSADERAKKSNAETKKSFGDVMKNAFTRNQTTGRIQGALYGASAILGTASMMPGQIGQAAQQALPSIGAMTAAMQLIPGPAGMVVGGLMAVAAISAQLDAHFKELRDAAAKNTKVMGASTEAMQKLSEFSKKVSSRDIMDKRRADAAAGLFYIKPGKKTFGESYMESESGKELAAATSDAIKNGDIKSAAALVTSQMGTAIAAGILSPEQARSVVANLAKQIKNTSFAIDINAKITSLFGPDGAKLEVAKNSIKLSMQALTTVVGNTPGQYANADAAAAGGGAVNSALLASMNTVQTGIDAVLLNPKSTSADIKAVNLSAQDAMKNIYDATDLQVKSNRDNVASAARDAANAKYKDTADAKLVEDVLNTIRDKNEQTLYDRKTGEKTKIGFTDTEEIFLTNMIGSGILSATNAKAATNMDINGADLVELLTTNAKATDVLLGLASTSGMSLKEQVAFMQSQKGLSAGELTARANALTTTRATTGAYAMDDATKNNINQYYQTDDGMKKAKNIDKIFKSLDKKKTVTFETVLSTVDPTGKNKVMQDALKSGDFNQYFSKLKDKRNKVIFTTEFTSLMNLGTKELAGPIKAWLAEKGRMNELMNFRGNDADIVTHFKTEYSAYEANRVTESGILQDLTTDPNLPTEEKAPPEASWLDQYVKTVRDAGTATQKLTTGFNDSSKALKNFASKDKDLIGLFSQLKKAGVNGNIIEQALGGDEATTDKLINRKTGQLKAGAAKILKGINDAVLAQQKIDWLKLTGVEKRGKYNEMYNANLDVLKISEDKINKTYDDRVKALDEIRRLNDKNLAQQQSVLSIGEALSRGDIGAAAQAALEMRKQNTQYAIEEQKNNLEKARLEELKAVTVDVNGVQMTRAEIEEKIRINQEKITRSKAEELEKAIRIGQVADAEYAKIQKRNGKLVKVDTKAMGGLVTGYATGGMVIPKGYAVGGGIYGTDTVPAMLTPGEFVVRKSAVDKVGLRSLNKLNSGMTGGDSVYNYTIQVNVKSDVNAKQIADTVLQQIEKLDAQRLRSVRL